MRRRTFLATLCLTICIFAMTSIAGAGCSTSKKFKLTHHQQLSGVFEDPAGAELSGLRVELVRSGSTVRTVTTDHVGRYDFGDTPAGGYRLRVIHGDEDFCAPKIHCRKEGCKIDTQLRVNAKHVIVVETAGR